MGTSCSTENGGVSTPTYKENGKVPSFKIVLIGDPGVGKTAVFMRYISHLFDNDYLPTKKPNIENVVKKINLPHHSVVSMTLWDLPGSEDIDLRSTYYRDVHAAIVVVDMTDNANIELAGAWKQDFLNMASNTRVTKETLGAMETTNVEMIPVDPNSIPVLLLGNKFDIVEKNIMVEESRGKGKGEETGGEDEPGEGKNKHNIAENEEHTDFDQPRRIWPNKQKPDCVRLLEETAVEHGFIGSVVVSAKDGDNSVHTSIQSLIRHLLEKHGNLKYKKKAKKKKKKPKEFVIDENGFQNLTKVEIPDFDRLFGRCNPLMEKAYDYDKSYEVALRKFKQACADAEVITEAKSSLEDCIIGLKRTIPRLRAEDDGDRFLRLMDDTPEDQKLPLLLQSTLRVYHDQYSLICQAILQNSKNMEAQLEKLEVKISEKSEQVWDIMACSQKDEKEKDPNYIYKVIDTCDRNRARIGHSRRTLVDTLILVENAYNKIQAALMW